MTDGSEQAPVADIRAAVDERHTGPQHLPERRFDLRLVPASEKEQVNPIPIREIDAEPSTIDSDQRARVRTGYSP